MSPSHRGLDAEVVVVGAGPVGLSPAIELGLRGVRAVVLAAGDGSVAFPAAEAIFSPTMQHIRRWGVAEEARSMGEPDAGSPHRIVFRDA
jgi:2-polyprenyl-6-methoxyphenol hydroxylase-like FAD-dependent oxidoreductase